MATPLYSIRLNPLLKARLLAIAEAEQRPLAQIIDRALTEYADAAEPIDGRKHLYVVSRSDGPIKIGATKHVEKRMLQFSREPRNKGITFKLEWVSQRLDNATELETQWKLRLGGKRKGNRPISETFDVAPVDAIALAIELINAR